MLNYKQKRRYPDEVREMYVDYIWLEKKCYNTTFNLHAQKRI